MDNAPHNPLTAPLSSEERNASAFDTNHQKKFTPIIPVPADAPSFTEDTPRHHNKKFQKTPSACYPYHTAEGGLIGYMVRWDSVLQEDGSTKKEPRPYVYAESKTGKNSWSSQGFPDPILPYNLPEIINRPGAPKLVLEGEKTAEASRSVFSDFVVTTSLYGGGSAHKTDWSFVRGSDIIISPDFDEAGVKYGDDVCTLCKKAGAKSIKLLSVETLAKKVIGKEKIPPKYDLADAVTDGLSKELLDQYLIEHESSLDDLLTPYFTQRDIESRSLPKGFRLDEKGNVLYFKAKKVEMQKRKDGSDEIDLLTPPEDLITVDGLVGEWKWLCTYLVASHRMRDGKNKNWEKVFKLIDADGVDKELTITPSMIAGDGRALKEILLSHGVNLDIHATHILKSYISQSDPSARARSFDKTGWHNHCYVLSEDKIYENDPKSSDRKKKERLVLNIPAEHSPVYEQKGTLEDWQKTMGRFVEGNSRLQFSILAALAAPLLSLLNEDNFGIHYVGSSSIGKTTALYVASSVWGKKIRTWRTTDNGAESSAKGHNDGLLMLDEISQVSGDAADAMIYMLGNGSGKARMTPKSKGRPISEFKLIFLSSGEIGLEAKLSESKGSKKLKAGQTVRFIEIPADAGQGMGVFENIHELESPEKFATHLKELLDTFRGTLIDAWLDFLTKNRDQVVRRVQNLRKDWLNNNPLETAADGQVERVKNKMALMAAVGEVAIENEFLPWKAGDASKVCTDVFNAWLQQRGGLEAHEVTQAIKRFRCFIAEHGSSRFENPWEFNRINTQRLATGQPELFPEKINKRAGFKNLVSNNQHYYIFSETFRKEILQGGDDKVLSPALASAGLLVTSLEQGKTRYTQKVTVPGQEGRKRYYCYILNEISEEES